MTLSHVRDVPVVRLGLGRVLLGWERPLPAEGVVIPIEGALVTVDPARPAAMPSCLIVDPDVATASVQVLYGEDAAAAVGRVCAEGAPGEARCAVDAGEELDQVVRLGVVRWCRQFSPHPLDHVLLRLEEMTLVGRLGMFIEDADGWAADLERACGCLIDRADDDVAAHADVEQLLIDALELLATTLPVADPISIEARALLSEREARTLTPGEASRGAWRAESSLPLALVAGDSATSGVATVDWFDVRRGLTSMAEDNVRWALEIEDDAAQLSVAVEGAPAVRPYGRAAAERERPALEILAFDAYVSDWPFAVLTGKLHFDEETWSWRGRSRVGAAQADLLRQALDAGRRPNLRVRTLEPAPAQNPAWASAHRWSCRGLAAARVSRGADDRAAATDLWLRAAELWRLFGDDDTGAACEQLAADLIAGDLSYDLTVAEAWLIEVP